MLADLLSAPQIASLGLRAGTFGARLVLMLALATELDPEEVGTYALVVATVTFGVYAVGLDFYTYSTREMACVGSKRWGTMITSQLVVTALAYALLGPVLWLAVGLMDLGASIAGITLGLIATQQLTQESDRVVIIAGRPLASNCFNAIRFTAWPVVVIAWTVLGSPSLLDVLRVWLASDLIMLGVGFGLVRSLGITGWAGPVQWAWALRGLRVSARLLTATVAGQALFTLDRYVVGLAGTPNTLGAYGVYASLALGLSAAASAGIHVFLYPQMVTAAARNDRRGLERLRRRMTRHTRLLSMMLIPAALGLTWLLVTRLLDDPVYRLNFWMLPVLLAAVHLFNEAMPWHYVLYAHRRDGALVRSTVLAVIVGGAVVALAIPLGQDVVPFGVLLGCGAWWVGLRSPARRLACVAETATASRERG